MALFAWLWELRNGIRPRVSAVGRLYDLMNSASSWEKVRNAWGRARARSAVTCQKSRMRLMKALLCMQVYVYMCVCVCVGHIHTDFLVSWSGLYEGEWHASAEECLLENARSSVDQSSTLDTSLSARRADARFMLRAPPRRLCVASLITNSSLPERSHAHMGTA